MKTDILDEFIKKDRLRREGLRKKAIAETRRALMMLSGHIKFKKAYLFGSILTDNFRETSDIDIAFEGLSDRDLVRAMAMLSECLKRDVDIIQLEDSRLREKVLRTGIRLI